MEKTKVTNRDAGFHSANVMQEIRGLLEHLSMAEVANKNIVTKLTEAVETLTRNNTSLTKKLSDAMKINLEMAKNLNLKATQAQEPEDKRLKEIARKMPFLKGTWTWTATAGCTGSELPRGTTAKHACHQRQATKGRQVEKISWEEVR